MKDIVDLKKDSNSLKVNFHTHSTFCDGKNTPEENVISAIKKGFKILGFSSHSTWPFPFGDSIKKDEFEKYIQEINSLKQKYADQIEIFCGFEADYIPPFCKPDFDAYKKFSPDFLIGSVHYLYNGENSPEKTMPVDWSAEKLFEGIKNIYAGDTKKMICRYFESERKMLSECNFSIIGHADLVRKFNQKNPFFNENESWYKNELKETAKSISRAGVICEINTGAISRGFLTLPYPSEYFFTLLHEQNVPIMLSSDSHAAETLDCAFEQAVALAKKIGYTELAYPKNKNIITYKF